VEGTGQRQLHGKPLEELLTKNAVKYVTPKRHRQGRGSFVIYKQFSVFYQ
jgi:hypothetical protein